jgi:hypothetical protein
MSELKLCCLIDPMSLETGILKLFELENVGKPVICKQCYDNLFDGIPEAVKGTDTKGVWEAVMDYIRFKIKQDHLKND